MCVRPSTAFYGSFSLDMGRSPGFGPAWTDFFALFTLGFPAAPRVSPLNLACTCSSPDRSTKSTRLRSCGASAACKHRVSGSLSLPSRGPFHLSFTVLCSIGRQVVFSLAGWSPRVPTGFHVPRGTLDPAALSSPSPTGLSPPMAGLPRAVRLAPPVACAVRTPPCTHGGLGSSGSARRYSRNRCFFLFLRLLRCFSSPGSPPCPMDSDMDAWGPPMRVSPFRHLRISGRVPLPAAFRSLPRLSSALSAKASALRPFLLDLSPPHSVAAVLPPPAHGCAGGAFSYFFISDVLMFQGFSLLVLYGVFKVHPPVPRQWRRRDSNS